MQPPARVRVRGIYTTALTALLLEQGYTIADASPAIQQRFGLPHREAPEDVSICDRRNRQGVIIEGEPAHVTEVVEGFQRALPQALVFPQPQDAQLPQENGNLRGDARRPLGSRYLTEFPATVKDQLDCLRSRTVPTLPGPHTLKIVDAAAADAAETRLAADPRQADALCQRLRQELILRHVQPGADVLVRHVKAGQSPVELWGQVQRFQAGTLELVRHFQGGGTYDGLRLPKAEGDWGTLLLTEGAWVTVRRYFRRESTPVGELYNIGTPVEFYPDHVRYVDLELDVVRLPDGTSRLEDAGVLVDKLARHLLPPALGQEAIRIAVALLQRLAAATAPRERLQ